MRTQVGIVGAGPAGLLLSHLLHLQGIDTIIVENRSRAYCEQRIRAGLLEQWSSDLLIDTGVGERLKQEAMFHDGNYLLFNKELHYLNFRELVGRGVIIYGQQEIVKDLIARRLADGAQILFEVEDTSIHDIDSDKPVIRFRHQGQAQEIACDFIGGCDGFHGICRPSIPDSVRTDYERDYPFGWVGILAESPPPEDELIYTYHQRGFALYTMRAPDRARLYLQSKPDDTLADWPDSRIWDELHTRLDGIRTLQQGEVVDRLLTRMHSFVTEPMQHGRLFLAGDSAHIVPPTGAKGLNLAFADVMVLSRAFDRFYHAGRNDLLDRYSQICLRRVWKAQRFSWWMTQMLHRYDFGSDFDMRRQLAELDYLSSSHAAQVSLAENYTGLPLDLPD
jgi:p-hydroxybenzoate 3-monooxygenase